MDAAEYKHVVLGLIFLKYVSDASANSMSSGIWEIVLLGGRRLYSQGRRFFHSAHILIVGLTINNNPAE